MNLNQLLLSKHAKSTTQEVIKWVGNDASKFKQLMDLVCGNDTILAQRAAWAMSYIVIDHPLLIQPHLLKLLKHLQSNVHQALKRNTFRFLKEIDLSERFFPPVIDACFNVANNPKEPIAVICFALHTLLKITKKFPEIKNEVLFLLELHQHSQAPGVQSTIKKIRKELLKL